MKASEAVKLNSKKITEVVESLHEAVLAFNGLVVGVMSEGVVRECERTRAKVYALARSIESGLATALVDLDVENTTLASAVRDRSESEVEAE